jgi:hypothetical protein
MCADFLNIDWLKALGSFTHEEDILRQFSIALREGDLESSGEVW